MVLLSLSPILHQRHLQVPQPQEETRLSLGRGGLGLRNNGLKGHLAAVNIWFLPQRAKIPRASGKDQYLPVVEGSCCKHALRTGQVQGMALCEWVGTRQKEEQLCPSAICYLRFKVPLDLVSHFLSWVTAMIRVRYRTIYTLLLKESPKQAAEIMF